jgi:hypothetical protein
LLSLCSGRGGDGEAETALSRQNGDDFYYFSTGKGADAAAILKRNPGAVLGWKLWQADESVFTVFFLLDPDEVRSTALWVKPARTEEQREAQRKRGQDLAAMRGAA